MAGKTHQAPCHQSNPAAYGNGVPGVQKEFNVHHWPPCECEVRNRSRAAHGACTRQLPNEDDSAWGANVTEQPTLSSHSPPPVDRGQGIH